jgi:hypothetical protein
MAKSTLNDSLARDNFMDQAEVYECVLQMMVVVGG